MKDLYYHYNNQGAIIFTCAKNGYYTDFTFIGYTLKEALKKFRTDNNLRYKHIRLVKLY